MTVDLPLAVGIPADYIADTELRLRLYRRIADLRDEAEVDALSGEFEDRFGPLPDMVRSLFFQMKVKLRAEKAGSSSVAWEAGQLVLRYRSAGNRPRPRSRWTTWALACEEARAPTGARSRKDADWTDGTPQDPPRHREQLAGGPVPGEQPVKPLQVEHVGPGERSAQRGSRCDPVCA